MAKTSSISLKTFPPTAEHLKVALAHVASGDIDGGIKKLNLSSSDKLRRLAHVARSLNDRGTCFFCGKKTPKPKKIKKSAAAWEGYELCPCLAKYTNGYREYVAWAPPASLVKRVEAGKLDPKAPAYSDKCADETCTTKGQRFTITVGQIVQAYKKYGTYTRAHRCLPCRNKLLTTLRKPSSKGVRPTRNQGELRVPMAELTHAPTVEALVAQG